MYLTLLVNRYLTKKFKSMKCISCTGFKPVFVKAYTRIRYGKLENVTQHCRSLPYQGQYRLFY